MAGGGGAAPTNTGQGPQAQVGGFGSATQTAINPQAQGGMGFGMGASGFADYDPNSTAPSILGGGTPAPGQMNWQVTDAQKTNLLAQQQARQAQPAPQQAMQQRAVSPLMQQQMMRQQPQQMYNPYQQQMMRQQPQQQMMRQQPQQQMYNPYQQQTGGLQAALMQLMGQYNQPMMRQQMPQYGQRPQTNPLTYRPDMSQAQAALSNVKPSVQKTNMDTMQARIAELEAQLAPRQDDTYYNQGGG